MREFFESAFIRNSRKAYVVILSLLLCADVAQAITLIISVAAAFWVSRPKKCKKYTQSLITKLNLVVQISKLTVERMYTFHLRLCTCLIFERKHG